MKASFFTRLVAAGLLLLLLAPAAMTQDARQVVDAVVAQVNDDIIMLSTLKNAMKLRVEALKQTGQTEEQAKLAVAEHRDQLIDALINDQLLVQKGKELGLSEEVEDEVNRSLVEAAKHRDQPLEKPALDELRVSLRTRLMIEKVFEREVDATLFFRPSREELLAYFKENSDKFSRPESVTLSEIFLRLHGKDELQVRAKAEALLTQLRGGADFRTLAIANCEREENGKRLAPTTGGKVGAFEVPMLRADLAMAIKDIKVGGFTDPIRTAGGYQILRVDERTPAVKTTVFNQNRVREVMTIERSRAAHQEYLQHLREEAYIAIAKDYQAPAPR